MVWSCNTLFRYLVNQQKQHAALHKHIGRQLWEVPYTRRVPFQEESICPLVLAGLILYKRKKRRNVTKNQNYIGNKIQNYTNDK